jgi:hypothetical protein
VVRTFRISRREAIGRAVFPSLWFLAWLCWGIFFRDPNYPLGDVGAVVAVVLFGLWPGLILSRWPFEVALSDDGVCEFRAPLRRVRVRVQQFKSIKGDGEDFDFVLRYKRGSVHLEGEDFASFLLEVVKMNPAVKIDIVEGWLRRALDEGRTM